MGRPQKHLKAVANSVTSPLIRGGKIGTLLYDVLKAKEDAKPPRLELHVSDTGRCPRQIGLRLTNTPKSNPPTFDSLMNFLIGNAIEDAVATALKEHPLVSNVYQNLEFKIYHNNHVIHGHSDILIELADGHILVECKSINSRAMTYLLKKGTNGKDDHRLQTTGYLYGSHFPDSPIPPRDTATIAYIVKDPTKNEPNVFEADLLMNTGLDELIAEYDKLCEVERMAERGQVAEIPEGYSFSGYPCTYCDWQKHCHGYEAEPNDEPPTKPEEDSTNVQ